MQLTTFSAPGGYPQSQVFADEMDRGFELSTLHHNADHLFFTSHALGKQAVSAIASAKQQLVTHFSTYIPEVLGGVDEQAASTQISAETIIETAKQVTGLSVKDLAGIFQVSRQTLYNFRGAEEKITERNWQRLQAISGEIENIAKIFTSSPGSLMKRVTVGGDTLYQLLCADVLNSARIEQLARQVAGQLQESAGSEMRHSTTIEQLTRHA